MYCAPLPLAAPIVDETLINGFSIVKEIVKDCAAVQTLSILFSLGILTRIGPKNKLLLLVWLSGIISFLNVFRLAFIVILAESGLVSWFIDHEILNTVTSVVGIVLVLLITAKFFPEYKKSIIYLFTTKS